MYYPILERERERGWEGGREGGSGREGGGGRKRGKGEGGRDGSGKRHVHETIGVIVHCVSTGYLLSVYMRCFPTEGHQSVV